MTRTDHAHPAGNGTPGSRVQQRPAATSTTRRRLGVVGNAAVTFVQEFPATFMVIAPFLILILPPAFLNQNPRTGFIVLLAAAAGGTTFVSEWFSRTVARSRHGLRHRRTVIRRSVEGTSYRSARASFMVGAALVVLTVAAKVSAAQLGIGAIDAQVQGKTGVTGTIGAVVSLLTGFDVIGVALLVWGRLCRGGARGTFWLLIGGSVVAAFGQALMLGITAPAFRYTIFVAVMLLLTGLLTPRAGLMFALLLVVLWPALYLVRNAIRMDLGVWVSQDLGAYDRLGYDRQVARAADFEPGVDIGQIGAGDIFRFGLIPRILDPERPSLNTAFLINSELLGGTSTSASTFLAAGTALVLLGVGGFLILYLVIGALPSAVFDGPRRPGAYSFCLLAVVVAGPLDWFSYYPDSIVGSLQQVVYLIPVILMREIAQRYRWRRPPRGGWT
ncbi:hypothetical protein KM867_05870 [Micrococcus luteus]|uniref:hypothetical protein n=2 Tax=Actinomycetes TaxID=1760 RepID=UPI001C248F8E|nr:hypothetical protein [Micrococcus luteus]MBU8650168.1 hypothetical protein [Micrococcus luteus]MCV7565234.1 hypothetical protein [Micrococcus luteus]MCV7574359.1 hypothetical protein [Micrococcus luteus]MCV7604520.1 hypothetical protein [Micrococcus luteus]